MDIVSIITKFSEFLMGLGVPLLLPIVITIIGLVFGQKFGKALRAGLTLGAGFIALNLVIGLLINTMVPVVDALLVNTGANLNILDVDVGLGCGRRCCLGNTGRINSDYSLPGCQHHHASL